MFNRLGFHCVACGKELTGGLDSYGDYDAPLCQECHLGMSDDDQIIDSWYGLAPHHHDLTLTGSFIGSTIFDPLPEPAPDGRYWILSRGAWFQPDDETGGEMGIWSLG